MNLLPAFGFLSSVCFCLAGFPSAYRVHKNGRSDLPPVTTWSILAGLILAYIYLHATNGFDPVVCFMYSVETATWLYVLRWLLWPREFKVVATCTEGVALANPNALVSVHVDGPRRRRKRKRKQMVKSFVVRTSERMKQESRIDEAQRIARNVLAAKTCHEGVSMMKALCEHDAGLYTLVQDVIKVWRLEGRIK